MRIKVLLCVMLIICYFTVTASTVKAQNGLSIGFSQKQEMKYLSLLPGETFNGYFVVWNIKGDTAVYYPYISGFQQVEDYPGTSIPLSPEDDVKDPYSASSWISTDVTSLELIPNKNFEIKFTITVPNDIALGEYHATIFFSTMNPDDITNESDTAKAFTNLATGPDFLIQIGDPSQLTEEMDLLKFTRDKQFYELPNVTFYTEIENTGNTHVRPMGDIIIYNFLGNEIARFQLNPQRASTLRGKFSRYQTQWNPERQILSEDNKIIFGPMRAELVATYKTENPGFHPIQSTTNFWIVPWKHLLAIIGGIGLIVLGARVKGGSTKKRSSAEK